MTTSDSETQLMWWKAVKTRKQTDTQTYLAKWTNRKQKFNEKTTLIFVTELTARGEESCEMHLYCSKQNF